MVVTSRVVDDEQHSRAVYAGIAEEERQHLGKLCSTNPNPNSFYRFAGNLRRYQIIFPDGGLRPI
jgi:hypothetical protein